MMTDRCDRCRQIPGWVLRLLLPLAFVSVLTFFLVGSSREFSDFAPVVIPPATLYVAAILAGAFVGWVSDGGRYAVPVMGVLALVPALVHAVAYVVLPSRVGMAGMVEMRDVLVLLALQRLMAYVLLMGMLVLAGTGFGLLVRSRLQR